MEALRYLTPILILVLIFSSPANAATPKPGLTCKKEGITALSQGKKFTCIKKGKKLVWNKGVKAKAGKTSAARPTTPNATPATPATPAPTQKPALRSYTMDEVKANNSAASCWSVIDGSVYNLTTWISVHPGGSSAIRSLCGIDATSQFNAQHSGQSRPTSQLERYLLGSLSR
jgi:cytochrome b involved in lipid metabolism